MLWMAPLVLEKGRKAGLGKIKGSAGQDASSSSHRGFFPSLYLEGRDTGWKCLSFKKETK